MVRPLVLFAMTHCKNKNSTDSNDKGKQTINKERKVKLKLNSALTKSRIKTECKYPVTSCRICLEEGCISIIGTKGLADKLNACTSIFVRADDAFPKFLCQACNSLLESAILLTETAQKSDKILREQESIQILESNLDSSELAQMTDESDSEFKHSEDCTSNTEVDYTYECSKCNLNFATSEQFIHHKLTFHQGPVGVRLTRIKSNDKSVSEEENETLEQEEHIAETEIENDTTHRQTNNVTNRKLSCVKCKIEFATLQELREHRLSPEHDEGHRINCPQCHKSYRSTYLSTHIKIVHSNSADYMCDICGKKFTHLPMCNRHRSTHFIGDLPYKCSLCPYKGRFSTSLKSHMRLRHWHDRKYQCEHCPRIFQTSSNLKRHILTHKPERDFQCTQCQRGFYTKRELDGHFKVDHTGIKEHICNLCGKAFGFRKQMMKHQLKFHKREKMIAGRLPLYLQLEKQQSQVQNSEIFNNSESGINGNN